MTTTTISGAEVAERLSSALPGIVLEADEGSVTVPAERIVEAATFVRDDDELDCKYLNTLLGVDWLDHFDIVYQVSSLSKNHTLTLKARASHEMPVVPSVASVWLAAVLQEREVYDLMGIAFSDHPGLKRIFLWEGFPGHPLRKDYLALPGGYKPGLQRFPFEFPEGQREYPALAKGTDTSAPGVPRLHEPPAKPFPILDDSPTGEVVAERVRAEEAGEVLAPQQSQGAGDDPTQAGGTAAEPRDDVSRDASGTRATPSEPGEAPA
jgi:NADH-quinone oxidoreductase subunit C